MAKKGNKGSVQKGEAADLRSGKKRSRDAAQQQSQDEYDRQEEERTRAANQQSQDEIEDGNDGVRAVCSVSRVCARTDRTDVAD